MSEGKISVTFHDLTVAEAMKLVMAAKGMPVEVSQATVEPKEEAVMPDVVELPFEVDTPNAEEIVKEAAEPLPQVSLDEVRKVMANRVLENPELKAENKAILAELGLKKLSEANDEQLSIIYQKVTNG